MLKIELYKCLVPISYESNKGYLLSDKVYPVKRTRRLGTQILVENGFWRDVPPEMLKDSKLFISVESLVFNTPQELNLYIDNFLIENDFKSNFQYDFHFSLKVLEIKSIKLTCGNFGLIDLSDYISKYELIYKFNTEIDFQLEGFLKDCRYGSLESSLIDCFLTK